jgi:hypothetical protein
MAKRSRDFDDVIRQSICAEAASVPVGDDGLERIRARLAQAQTSAAADDREIAVRGARSARAHHLCAGHGHGEHLATRTHGSDFPADRAIYAAGSCCPIG